MSDNVTYHIFDDRRLLLIAGFLFSFSILFGQDTKEKLNSTRKQLEDEIDYTSRLLDQTKKTKEISLRDLQLLNRRIEKREALIHTIGKEISEVDRQIQADNILIDKRSRELKALKDEYARMIYYAYKIMKSQNRLVFIFSASDFNQAYQRLKYYQQYSVYRKKQIKLIQQTQDKLTHKKQELETQKTTQKQLLSSNENEKQKLTKEQEIKNQAVKNLQKTEKALLATLRKKEAEAKKLQKDIKRIIDEEVRKAREASIARAEAAKKKVAKADTKEEVKVKEIEKTKVVEEKFKKSADIMSATPEELELSTSFTNNKGRLPWPSEKGIISSTFGPHSHPELPGIVINNDGIDITTNRGANARSVFNGEVAAVISGPNGKQVVIVRHGNYLTVYSNLENVFVRRGEKISTKQRIGTVYTDNDDNKTVLQFQIWKGNAKMNPSDWIAR